MEITTLIFDLDGLLADTEKLHRTAYRRVLAEAGIALTDGEYDEHWIRRGKGIREYVAEHDLRIDYTDLRSRKAALYRALVLSGAEPMPGALEALRSFHGHRTLALATSSYRDAALAVLTRLQIKDYFACIAASEDAERSKPFPDLFLHVANALHAEPRECLVIEDSEKGILAATAAGMRSVAVPNVHTALNDFTGAAAVLPSLLELTPERVAGLERLTCDGTTRRRCQLREAVRADCRAIADLLGQLGYPTTPTEAEERVTRLSVRDTEHVFVAAQDGKVVGVVAVHLTPLLHTPGNLGRITALVIDKEHRKQGMGKRLVSKAESWAWRHGCSRMEVTSGEHRTDAHRFYEACGYRYEEKRFLKARR